MINDIGIIGAGAWGSALAAIQTAARRGVRVWSRSNPTDISMCNVLIYALPAQVLRAYLIEHPLLPHQTLVIAAKGIEVESALLLPQVVDEVCKGAKIAVLSGPNIADEIARGLPAAATIAAPTQDQAIALQSRLSTRTYRLYPSTDVVGVSCGGAVKNVIAIALGMVEGLGLGENARAALMTRGLAEMARLSMGMGGQRDTMMGLSGAGDLALKSRNYRYGVAFARGTGAQEFLGMTVEGVPTARALVTLAAQKKIDMPIALTVAACLGGDLSVTDAVDTLMQRPARGHEHE